MYNNAKVKIRLRNDRDSVLSPLDFRDWLRIITRYMSHGAENTGFNDFYCSYGTSLLRKNFEQKLPGSPDFVPVVSSMKI